MRLPLFVVAIALASVSLSAKADPVSTGTYGGTELASISRFDKNAGMNYTDDVYADANNPLCPGCLDFVLTVSDPEGSLTASTDVSTTGFTGYSTELAYADEGNAAPTDGSVSKNGNKVTFDYNIFGGAQTDSLIIYTNATSYTDGGLTIGILDSDPPAYAPSGTPVTMTATPEPSSIALLGTGLLGFAGAVRRRLA